MEDDWEALTYDDDYESRYADDLEVLREMEDDERFERDPQKKDGPRKSLVFPTPDKVENVHKQPPEQPGYKKVVAQGFKRQIDEMYALLSDGEESEDNLLDDLHTTNAAQPSQAKRARISNSPETNINHSMNSRSTRQPVVGSSQNITRTCKVLTRPPIGKECISLSGCDGGRRVYLHITKDESLEANKIGKKKSFGTKRPAHLLGVPFSVIKETIYEQRRMKLLEESKRLTDSLNSALADDLVEDNIDDMTETEAAQEASVKEKSLWVDKYSPRSYMELLSDDGINRNLLSWLKLWDGVVFGKEKAKKKKNTDEKLANQKEKKFSFKEENTDWMELDATGRPPNKVALLCGPPGLGKTTLAHIVAQHAGYSVVEMNASDDRSVEVFRNKIESTTQMQSVLDSGKKPNCLIIDEIDGAPTPAINVLLSVIKTKKDSEPAGPQKKKKSKKQGILSRPIICICNDPYVPALRLLRQQAFVLTFPHTIPGRLAQRLMEVSRKELFKTDMTTLLALCEKTENDIRSCLNTLQFLRQKRQNLTIDYIQSANIGQKDTQKSLFSLWQAIFQLPRPKKKRFSSLARPLEEPAPVLPEFKLDDPSNPELTSSAARFYNMLHMASSNGQYNKLENGIFENYLNMKFKDAYLNQVVSGTEWLQFTDLVSQSLLQQQNFILMRYQPFLSVAFHMLFAAPSQRKLSYPSVGYENTLKETKNRNVVSSMLSEVSPQLRGNLDLRTITAELLPLLLHIITPTLRPVNMQLFSPSEKQQLTDLIKTMISYNLTYHQERNIEGQYSYALDPKIEDVVKFPGLPQHKQLTYATKQVLAREINLEKMRMIERAVLRNSSSKNEESSKTEEEETKAVQTAGSSSPVVLHLKPKQVKTASEKLPQAKDFFGRPIVTQENVNISKNTNHQHSPFWFKFQEGFSNAVRRTIKIQDLL
ncbi:chromosome transmission fidelity protein 18 homolog isoform X2 [Dendronephthya gigantea]|nr:chromosome transmission fidelity protein 18 homolog isoform X2 [Dendronephthya gigantea]XP_028395276.1 chromosome transmission fidelity protein 18 homolog isoform X2 [Dendronephthya gigantea]